MMLVLLHSHVLRCPVPSIDKHIVLTSNHTDFLDIMHAHFIAYVVVVYQNLHLMTQFAIFTFVDTLIYI